MSKHTFYILAWASLASVLLVSGAQPLNNRPIIAVVSREVSSLDGSPGRLAENYTSFIAASYVKFLEGAGARVVPVLLHRDRSYYVRLFQSVNGVLFPGGSTWHDSHGYGRVGRIFYDLATQANRLGDHFPIWGTCLGFEFLAYLAAGERDPRCRCYSEDAAMPLNISKDFWESRMFRGIPTDVLTSLVTEPITVNFHNYCLTQTNFTRFGLDKTFRILSTNRDANGITFISSMEGIDLPFYAVQFHPEKNLYEWNSRNQAVPHSHQAVKLSQFMADILVNEARKSTHRFQNEKEESQAVIYNYPATYTGKDGSFYDQIYFLK